VSQERLYPWHEDEHLISDSDSEATDIETGNDDVDNNGHQGEQVIDRHDPNIPTDKEWWGARKRRF
jgi:hypothetical protein